MSPTLVRVLSTGRAGTRFLAGVFAAQGHLSFHEGLYTGEPSSAIIEYTKMLGNLWIEDRDQYYSFTSNFPEPYVLTVKHLFGLANKSDDQRGLLRSIRNAIGSGKKQPDFLVDCSNRLMRATPMVFHALSEAGITVKHLILVRNPLKMIHAIYKVETPDYWTRPANFWHGDGVLAATRVWANSYRMIYDISQRLGGENYFLVRLEAFTAEEQLRQEVADFLGINFNEHLYHQYRKQALEAPRRRYKEDTARNSDIFHDPNFVISDNELDAILAKIKDILQLYDFDPEQIKNEYIEFHAKEKAASFTPD